MRHVLLGVVVCAFMASACDKPDEVYRKLPSDFDPGIANGFVNNAGYFTGAKGFIDETLEYDPGITVEVCSDSEIAAKQVWMVAQPIIPMKGGGGLDMRGSDEWEGLTVDEAQTPDMLCQALYYADGVAAWGDYYELITWWDTQTREIDAMMMRSGYIGTLTTEPEAGGDAFVFEVNEPIMKGTTPLARGDGGARDPRSEANMRAIDQELIRSFRPQIEDPDAVDCVEAGSCYIIMSGTLPVLVFTSVEVYIVLEPIQWHIVNIQLALKRPFTIAMGSASVSGVTPTIEGTTAAGIPDCSVTYDTTWAHVRDNCMTADDSIEMAQLTSVYGYEYILAHMGGVLLYFKRDGLAVDEIIGLDPDPEDGDTAAIVSLNAGYEGAFAMPYSEVLGYFKASLDAAIRDEVPGLGTSDPTGVEKIRLPGDTLLPSTVSDRYPDRLRPGSIWAAFCEDDGNDDGVYDSCETHSSGRPTMPLASTVLDYVAAALGGDVPKKLSDPSFYVMHFERAMGQYFNGGTALDDDQINFSPNVNNPDRVFATMVIPSGGENYTILMYYGGNDDRWHFINFQKGASRQENVLFADAALPTPGDPARDNFTFIHLLTSPRMGLGAKGTITVSELVPETRRAVLDITLSSSLTAQVLAPYFEASSITGYWIPLEGPHQEFVQADWFSLSGPTIGAGFYLQPSSYGSEEREVTAVVGSSFFGQFYFCGVPVRIGDYADELIDQIEDADYACNIEIHYSENREFITAITDVDAQMKIYVANNMIDQVFAWLR